MNTVAAGVTTDSSGAGVLATVYNVATVQNRTAPIPYVADTSGSWTTAGTWANGSEWDITSLPNKDWAIVQVTNNSKLTTTASHTHLGLLVDSGSELEIQNDQLLNNTSYVKLDGHIDLVGESQFIQTAASDLDVTSSGYLERDQDGKSNLYQYNFWSSPVSTVNTTANNQAYTVAGVLRDGTTPATPQPITWNTTGYDGAPGSPITLADFWIYQFENQADLYANWNQERSTGSISVGEGYTLKGSGAGTATQNYTFTGKPNNGIITHPIGANNLYLVGNPYASALDAHTFIDDNINSVQNGDFIGSGTTTGTIYFWEHWGGNSHYLAQYEGGYATLNKLGFTMAVPDPDVSSNGNGALTPRRYIPVGQGFVVQGDADGGTVTFNNGQRVFEKESGGNSTFFKSGNEIDTELSSTSSAADINRVYFRFTTPEGPSRQLLLGVQEGLTEGVEYGYDAKRLNEQHTDCGWRLEEEAYVIQGIGAIYNELELPLTVQVGTSGTCKFNVESLADLEDNVEVYFRDNELQAETRLEQTQGAEFTLEAGEYTNRFSVVFKVTEREELEDILDQEEEELSDNLLVYYNTQEGVIQIKNPTSFSASSIRVYNSLGQLVLNHTKQHQDVTVINIPVNVSTGAYMVQFVYNNSKEITKKLLIK